MNNELKVIEDKKELISSERKPAQIVKLAMEAAKELQKIVGSRNKKLKGKQYLFFEDWQTLGRFDRTTAKVIDTKELYHDNKLIGFSAKAVALKDEIEISAAEAECCFDEQLKSMAQTRACAKALRNCLAFVAVLANYEPTPAEEMIGNDKPVQKPKSKSNPTKANPDLATQPQKDEIYGNVICEKCGTRVYWYKCPKCGNTDLHIIKKGFLHSHLMTKDDFKKEMKPTMHHEKLTKWWRGNKDKLIIGERTKREAKEKEAKPEPTKEEKIKQAREIVDGKLELREGHTGLLEDEEITDEDIPGSNPDNAIPFKGKKKALKKISKASDFVNDEDIPNLL